MIMVRPRHKWKDNMHWLNEVPRVRWYNLQELLQKEQKCTLTSFVALEKRSDQKMKKEQGISFTTILQHTDRIWVRIS
jgi:hypothetical protein